MVLTDTEHLLHAQLSPAMADHAGEGAIGLVEYAADDPRPKVLGPLPLWVEGDIHRAVGRREVPAGQYVPPVELEARRAQVIQNIVLNARDAMVTGGTISMSCENVAASGTAVALVPDSNCVTISISDTGPGISPKDLKKNFDPYFSTKPSGTGLGLAICHSIVRKHEGHLTVSSANNGGTTFKIWLPASTLDLHPLVTEAVQKSASDPDHKITILLLDDEAMIRTVASKMLRQFGHEVILAEHGREAIDLYAKHFGSDAPIDIVIMDLTIPGGMGGEESVKEILQIDPDAKVIVSSGYSNAPIMANFRDYGFMGSISKPFRVKDLIRTINDLMRSDEEPGTD